MDWSQPVSGAIGGAFGLLGNYLNYKYQSRLADKQNEFNLNMWNLQNEYNSPAAQMRRYEEAGLNPALMYGQVTPGNASTAPQQVTPNAPNFSRDLKDLAQAFNIEGIKQAIADTKLKQANARAASAAADRAEGENEALDNLQWNYHFEPSTGQYVFDGGVLSREGDTFTAKPVYPNSRRIAEGLLMKTLSDNFRTNSLLVPRGHLIGSQALLNSARYNYTGQQLDYLIERQKMFAPQLRMLEYQSKNFPVSFWIGSAARGAQAVSPFLPLIF